METTKEESSSSSANKESTEDTTTTAYPADTTHDSSDNSTCSSITIEFNFSSDEDSDDDDEDFRQDIGRLSAGGVSACGWTSWTSWDVNQIVHALSQDELEVNSEVDVFNAACHWLSQCVDNEQEDRIVHAERVLSCVRFAYLNEVDILKCCRRNLMLSNLISTSTVVDMMLRALSYKKGIRFGWFDKVCSFKPRARIYLGFGKHGFLKTSSPLSTNINIYLSTSQLDIDEQDAVFCLHNWAAEVIQRRFRRRRLRLIRRLFNLAAVVIQTAIRGYLCRTWYANLRNAAIVIQSFWRGYIDRKEISIQHLAAIIIQSRWRAYRAREGFLLWKEAATLIQCVWRGYLTRLYVKIQKDAINVIQKAYRGYKIKKNVTKKLKSLCIVEQKTSDAHEELVIASTPSPDSDIIMVMGGVNPAAGSDHATAGRGMLRFDVKKESWELIGYLPVRRYFAPAVFVNGFILMAGGADPAVGSNRPVPTKATWTFHLSDRRWTEAGPMNRARVWHGLVGVRRRAFAVGGRTWGGHCESTIEVFDLESQWTLLRDAMPRPRAGLGVTLFEGLIWVVGGVEGEGSVSKGVISDAVNTFDPVTERWTTMTNLRFPRVFPALAAVGKSLLVIGGAIRSPNRPNESLKSINEVDVWDFQEQRWCLRTNLKMARHHATTAVIGERLYILGGVFNEDDCALSSVECCEPNLRLWHEMIDLPIPSTGHSSFVISYKSDDK